MSKPDRGLTVDAPAKEADDIITPPPAPPVREVERKLAYVQQNLKAPKGQFNKFGGYKYRSCEDIFESLKPLLKEVGATVVLNDRIEMVGQRTYIVARATFRDFVTGDWVCTESYAREPEAKKGMDEAQVTGMASSYARKYALNALFLIDDGRDPDTMDNRNAGQGHGGGTFATKATAAAAVTGLDF